MSKRPFLGNLDCIMDNLGSELINKDLIYVIPKENNGTAFAASPK
jgi:hypothetical protein